MVNIETEILHISWTTWGTSIKLPGKMWIIMLLKVTKSQGFTLSSEDTFTAEKMKFSIKGFFSKCDQICSFLRIWLHLLKKSLMENFIFCAVIFRETTRVWWQIDLPSRFTVMIEFAYFLHNKMWIIIF